MSTAVNPITGFRPQRHCRYRSGSAGPAIRPGLIGATGHRVDNAGDIVARPPSGSPQSLRVKLPGHYERLDEFLDCTPLEYSIAFSGDDVPNSNATVQRLREAAGET